VILEGDLSTLTVAQVDDFVVSTLNQWAAGKEESKSEPASEEIAQ
jgi:hypothetical protein